MREAVIGQFTVGNIEEGRDHCANAAIRGQLRLGTHQQSDHIALIGTPSETSPWQWQWDMSIKKSFAIRERHRVDIGADLINWMNHPTFYVGNESTSSTRFNVNNTTFGRITSTFFNPRRMQFSLRYSF